MFCLDCGLSMRYCIISIGRGEMAGSSRMWMKSAAAALRSIEIVLSSTTLTPEILVFSV